jgi:hypothetical protein
MFRNSFDQQLVLLLYCQFAVISALISLPAITLLQIFVTALAPNDEASRSARHHWDALLCSNLLPVSNGGGQKVPDRETPPSDVVKTVSGNDGSSGKNGSSSSGNKGNPSTIATEKSWKMSPCKAMKFKYKVVPGVSWGTLNPDLQL